MAGGSWGALHLGEKIVVAGLIIQVLFFGFFIITSAIFHTRLRKSPSEKSLALSGTWHKHITVLYIANILIMIRSIFRTVEYAMGNNGYLLRHEVFLYVFDGLLMFSVMLLFNFIHPSELLAFSRGKHS